MPSYKYYYQMPKGLFLQIYKLTDEDKKDIDDSVKLGFDYETAKGLRLNKIYEDSKKYDKNYIDNVKKMLKQMEKAHEKLSKDSFSGTLR